jgi:DNA-binding PadR family transcriptional regulator
MKETTTEYLILGILRNKSRTGYDINKVVKTRLGPFWDINYSQIYPTLRELEKNGTITKRIEINERGQNRKVYSITNEGKNKLKEWLLKPAKPEKHKIELMLKIGFGEQVSTNELIKQVQAFRERHEAQLENVYSIEKELKAQLGQNEANYFLLLSLELGVKFHVSAVDWANTTITKLRSRDK